MKQDWGLVLSGGGAKGAYQIGVWRAMQELSLETWIAGIAGASIGSLNAALFAGGDYRTAETAWSEVDLLSVFDTEWALLDGREGAFSREEMLTLIRRYVSFQKLKTEDRPIVCSVSRLPADRRTYSPVQGLLGETVYTGEYMRLDGRTEETIEEILMASSAMPVIYQPVEIGGAYYQDGGLTDNLPIRPLYELGFRRMLLIGLDAAMKRFQEPYPDVEFLAVYPSRPLGDLLEGTLNFRPRYIRYAQKLGYLDGRRILRAYLDGDADPVRMQTLEEQDHRELEAELRREELRTSVDEHMDTLNRIIGKYS